MLHLRSETVDVLRRMNMMWMINDVHMIRRDELGPYFLTFVSQFRKTSTRKLSRPEVQHGHTGGAATTLHLGHGGCRTGQNSHLQVTSPRALKTVVRYIAELSVFLFYRLCCME